MQKASDLQLDDTLASQQHVEKELLIGWGPKVPVILREYADYVCDGSRIDVLVHNATEEMHAQMKALQEELTVLDLRLIDTNPMLRQDVLALQPFEYDNIMILSARGVLSDPETTDAQTIVILLTLRQIFAEHKDKVRHTKLVSEVMDTGNRKLVSMAGVNDFIVSNKFISMLLAQYSEEPKLEDVYNDLFSEDGSEIYLKSIQHYMSDFKRTYRFIDLVELAAQRKEVCIGVKLKEQENSFQDNFGVSLNPAKDQTYTLCSEDCLVVLAEDEF